MAASGTYEARAARLPAVQARRGSLASRRQPYAVAHAAHTWQQQPLTEQQTVAGWSGPPTSAALARRPATCGRPRAHGLLASARPGAKGIAQHEWPGLAACTQCNTPAPTSAVSTLLTLDTPAPGQGAWRAWRGRHRRQSGQLRSGSATAGTSPPPEAAACPPLQEQLSPQQPARCPRQPPPAAAALLGHPRSCRCGRLRPCCSHACEHAWPGALSGRQQPLVLARPPVWPAPPAGTPALPAAPLRSARQHRPCGLLG